MKSNTFWISIAVIFLIYLAYHLGVEDNKPWTKDKEREAISGCNKWGGEVVRNSKDEYVGCSINGRIDE